MGDPCPHCGHALWSEVRSKRAFRFVVFFDDDERSATYAARVRSCPECSADLLGHALTPRNTPPVEGFPSPRLSGTRPGAPGWHAGGVGSEGWMLAGPYAPTCGEKPYEKVSSAGKAPRHEANHRSVHERFAARTQPLVIFAHPPLLVDPRKRPFHYPSTR
jgi:hypothetical protein